MPVSRPHRFLIAGGGSGGHIYPALAIAEALRAQSSDCELLFVGALGKMEMTRVPAAGMPIVGIPVSGFHRGFDHRNIRFPLVLAAGMRAAWRVVRDFGPDAAIGTGGFVSGPALMCATWQGVATFVQEQNAYPGVTNRLLARSAQTVFGAYPQAAQYFPRHKFLLTGNPLRSVLRQDSLPEVAFAKTFFGLDPQKPTLLSFGGSLGAASMNRAARELHSFWAAHPELQLIWQTGETYYSTYRDSETARLPNVACVPYLEQMDVAYAAADLVACRAGALSIAELQLLGKPALLIPSPNVAGDHQTANARAVAESGGARLVLDNTQVEMLPSLLRQLLLDSSLRAGMAQAMLKQARPNSALDIVKQILAHVNHHA